MPRVAFAVAGIAQRAAALQSPSLRKMRGNEAAFNAVTVFTKLRIALGGFAASDASGVAISGNVITVIIMIVG